MTLWVRFAGAAGEGFGTFDPAAGRIAVHRGDLFDAPSATGETVALDAVRLLTPVRPGTFIGLWNNFRELAAKLNQAIPTEPLYFLKATSACLDPEGVIAVPAHYDGKVVYEGELGVVIGKTCRGVSEAEAEAAIFGYTCVNDVTALDAFGADPAFAQWTRAKSFDSFGPFGPAIATGLDWSSLRVRTVLNGRERQNYPTNDMILAPARIVSLIAREMTLRPGDLIACGTSVGVLPMRSGMTVEVTIDGIGTLRNTVQRAAA